MIADVPTKDILGKRYGWGMASGKVVVLLVFSGLYMDRNAEVQLLNMYVNIKEGDMGHI